MFVQTIDNFDPGRKVARRPCLPSLFIALALAFAFAIHPSEAQAQIVGDIDRQDPIPVPCGQRQTSGRRVPHPPIGRFGPDCHGNHQWRTGLLPLCSKYKTQTPTPLLPRTRVSFQQIREIAISSGERYVKCRGYGLEEREFPERRTERYEIVSNGRESERLELRQKQSVPILAELHRKLLIWKEQLLPKHFHGRRRELHAWPMGGADRVHQRWRRAHR